MFTMVSSQLLPRLCFRLAMLVARPLLWGSALPHSRLDIACHDDTENTVTAILKSRTFIGHSLCMH